MDVFTTSYRLHKNPLRDRWNYLKYILGSIDALAIFIAFQLSYQINNTGEGRFFFSEPAFLILFLVILPFWLLILNLIKVTGIPTKRYKVLFFLYMQSAVAIFFLLIFSYFVFSFYIFPRLFLIEFSLLGFIMLFLTRILTYSAFRMYGDKGHHRVNIVIIADDSSIPFIDNLLSNTRLGYKAIVIFTESFLVKEKYEKDTIILSEKFIGILRDLIEVDFIDEVIYLKEKIDSAKIRETVASCEDMGITLRIRYDNSKISLSSAVKSDISDGRFLSFLNIPNNTFAVSIKKTGDINMALLLIVVLAPLLLLISIVIKLTSRGPVITRISTTGWRGHQIDLLRFRTMIIKADQGDSYPESELDLDYRLSQYHQDFPFTRVGKFLYRSGLDQLPELFNILKGEMSITGPRHPLHQESSGQAKIQ